MSEPARDPFEMIIQEFDSPDAIKNARLTWDSFPNYEPDQRWGVTLWSVAVFTLGEALRKHNLNIVRRPARKAEP